MLGLYGYWQKPKSTISPGMSPQGSLKNSTEAWGFKSPYMMVYLLFQFFVHYQYKWKKEWFYTIIISLKSCVVLYNFNLSFF